MIELSGTVILPDGRKVFAIYYGYNEYDTNAFIETGYSLAWGDVFGDDLTADDENEVVAENYHLHEWVAEKVQEANDFCVN